MSVSTTAAQPNNLFLVPFKRNPGFVGRSDELTRLRKSLQGAGDIVQAVGIIPTGLTGMGGIGKTQLAVEYVYRYRDYYPGGIFWLNAAQSNQACGEDGYNLVGQRQMNQATVHRALAQVL
jgi:hypothetical protein